MQSLYPGKTGLWRLLLCLCLIPLGHTQETLAIHAEEVCVEKVPDQEGFHLFIKKKPGLSSVLLTESTKDFTGQADTYSFRALEWNEINGNEIRIIASPTNPIQVRGLFLVDSSPEYHPLLGEAFHIYLPPRITYGYSETRHATLEVEDGIFINIRTFALPYANYAGPFKDNPFTLFITRDDPDTASPPLPDMPDSEPESLLDQVLAPDISLLPSDPEQARPVIRLILPDLPVFPDQDSPPDLSATPTADQEARSIPPDPETAHLLEEIMNRLNDLELPPEPIPKEEGPVFAPVINIWGGAAIFFPGPEGMSLGLKNSFDPIGTITLTNRFTKTWGFHLGFDRDPMLMNRLFARATWDTSFISLEAGPYFGFLNSKAGHISPGLSLVLHLRIPRWNLFSAFQHDTNLGKNITGPGDYIQPYSEIKVGFMLPFGRLILSMIDRNSSLQDDQGLDIVNHWIRYNLALEIALPRSPLGFRLDMGYQKLHWTSYIAALPLDYEYWDVYAGLEASYRIGSLTLVLGLEAPLYPFVYPQLQSLAYPEASFFGQIILGFRWTFPHHD